MSVRRRRRNIGGGIITLVTDTFTRVDNPASLGSTESPVIAWVAGWGIWSILSNQARIITVGGGGRYDIAYYNSGRANGSMVVKVGAVPSGGIGSALGISDASNFIRAEWQGAGAGQFIVVKCVANIDSVIGSAATSPLVVGDDLKCSRDGTALSGYINGVLGPSGTDAFNIAATNKGMTSFNSTSQRFEEINETAP